MQYFDTGKYHVIFVLVLIAFLLFNIIRAKGGKSLFIRRIAGLAAIDEAVGRSTEMGRPVLMVPGLSGLGPVGIQAVRIFAYITKTAVKFSTPIRLCLAEAALYSVAQEIIRDVYQAEGVPEKYDPNSVRFVSDRQFAFAAGVAGMIYREKIAAAFLMGDWFAESLILAESANAVGAIQVAASTVTTQTPFLIAACDYVLIGDEFYAASAYLSREPVLVGSLVGQDWSKMAIVSLVLGLTFVSSCDRRTSLQLCLVDATGNQKPLKIKSLDNKLVSEEPEPFEDPKYEGKSFVRTVFKETAVEPTEGEYVKVSTEGSNSPQSFFAIYKKQGNGGMLYFPDPANSGKPISVTSLGEKMMVDQLFAQGEGVEPGTTEKVSPTAVKILKIDGKLVRVKIAHNGQTVESFGIYRNRSESETFSKSLFKPRKPDSIFPPRDENKEDDNEDATGGTE